ncbi:MAG: amidase [Verrucomicrobia bacterium]|nr:amidase [Verrucomicrobiota bacterium]
MQRRAFLQHSALLGLGMHTGLGLMPVQAASAPTSRELRRRFSFTDLAEMSVAELQAALGKGDITSADLTKAYLQRIDQIDRSGPRINSVIELNPDAITLARQMDRERKSRSLRSPMHGIPILIKDNIDTADRMSTTAGSLALQGSIAARDAFLVRRLREAGVIILGKANLSEWANFRGQRSISGWSGRGGLTRNPYVTDRSTSGSSAGSAAAVAAGLCAAAIGTETNGSIVSPASYCGIVGLKPTVGLISRSGIIPIASSQDTAGPMTRCVADAAALLGLMTGQDELDPATAASAGKTSRDYTSFLDAKALHGARLGFVRSQFSMSRLIDPILEGVLKKLQEAGAVLVDNPKLPSRQDLGDAEFQVMLYEFKHGLNAYLRTLGPTAGVKNLEELIEFNERHRDRELVLFGQELLLEAQSKGPLTDDRYVEAKAKCVSWSKDLASALETSHLDALIAPTTGPSHVLDLVVGDRGLGGSSTYAAVSGLPSLTVPCGELSGLPMGLSFIGRAWQEGKLLALGYAFEKNIHARRPPSYLPHLETR